MDDLIWRQDAVDALLEWYETPKNQDAVDVIRNISPAQQWTPCSEQLPKRMTDDDHFIIWNLVCCSSTDISVGYFDPDQKEWYVEYPAKADDVIAWMPLPKPYSKKNQKMKIEFTKDFAGNWKAGEIVEVKDLGTGEMLVDNVAKVDTKLLFEYSKIISKNDGIEGV